MNQTILVALIGTTGVIVGAVLTFLASTITVRFKIKEIDITHQQKLDETYLANARLYIDSIYLPINIALTKLSDEYRKFKSSYQTIYQPKLFYLEDDLSEEEEKQEFEEKNEQEVEEFRQKCSQFLEQITEMTNAGKDAYLTVKLDEYLQSFIEFLENSMFATIPAIEPKTAKRFQLPDYIRYLPYRLLKHKHGSKNIENSSVSVFLAEPAPRKGLGIHNSPKYMTEVKIPDYETMEGYILEAPITSYLFRERFLSDIRVLKSLIKEVTLGAISTKKPH